MIVHFYTPLAIVCYLLATGLLVRPLVNAGPPLTRPAMGTALVAVLLQLAVSFGLHRGALDLHFFAALGLVAGTMSALTVLVNMVRPVAALGVIVFPMTAILLAIDVYLAPATSPLQIDWQIKLHVTLALLAFGVLLIAALLAIFLSMQERALRRRSFNAWLRVLPPLTLTESLLFKLIAAGFVLLTATLVTGALFVSNLFGQHLVHKTVLSILAWLVFGALLFGRWRYGWRGRPAVNLTLIGMSVLMLAFLGSKLVLELILHRVG